MNLPILNVIVALAILAVPILWASKGKGYGLWSALLNLICCIAAGGIAFAVWEPLVYKFVLPIDNNNNLLRNIGWSACLLAPYIVSLLVLRILVDTFIKANLKFSDAANFVGGVVFGLGAGIITMGIIVTSFSYMRVSKEALGYEPIGEDGGNLIYEHRLWIPVDALTVMFYESLSRFAFGSDTPLALHRPDAHIQGALTRFVAHDDDNKRIGYTHISPDAFKVLARYQIADSVPTDTLLTDTMTQTNTQMVVDIRGKELEGPARLYGFVIQFLPAAREASGQVVIGPGQVRLVCQDADATDGHAYNPIAIIAESDTKGVLFRYPANTPDFLVGSIGNAQSTAFGFEFAVPADLTPTELLVRGVRVPLTGDLAEPKAVYESVAKRDAAINGRRIFEDLGISVGGVGIGDIDTSQAVMIPFDNRGMPDGFLFSANLPYGYNLHVTTAKGGFLLDANNKITNGETTRPTAELTSRDVPRNLRVSEIAMPGDSRIVQITVAQRSQLSEFGKALDQAPDKKKPPYLIADDGRAFPCVGFVYSDGTEATIRFRPDALIDAYDRLPQLSVSKREESLVLFFLVNSDSNLTGLSLGNMQVASFPRSVRQQ